MSTAKTPNLQPRNVNTLANQRQTAAQRRMKAQRARKRLKPTVTKRKNSVAKP